ncbi:MAG TPA: Na(+)/H(+) antiporter subunit B [Wenzhouxiangella sp.]|nr:Na(+)/H(+) antiporter subunit B [Wenzhouxiangella sp.]
MSEYAILRIVARFLIPLIMLFGLYVQFHGDQSPGGGFQAGVIFAAAWILFVLIYGLEAGFKVIPQRAMFILMCCGVLIYGGTGLFGVILGAHFLSFEPFLSNPQAAEQFGIISVELGVGLTVATVMMVLFSLFAQRRQLLDEVSGED